MEHPEASRHRGIDRDGVPEVATDEFAVQAFQIGCAARREIVQHAHLVSPCNKGPHEVGAYEARSSSHEALQEAAPPRGPSILTAAAAAPRPLSTLTTVMPGVPEASMDIRGAMPPNGGREPPEVGTATTGPP